MENRYHKVSKNANKAKWIFTYVLIAILIIGFAGMTLMFVSQNKTKDLTVANYEIGELTDAGLVVDQSDGAVRTKDYVKTDGLKVEIGDDSDVTYSLYFYNADKQFISVQKNIATNYYGVVPKEAKYAKVVISPVSDEDGKVDNGEFTYYVAQITVTYNR